MFTSIFSALPKGVTIRRLDNKRKAQNQDRAYKFSAWKDNGKLVYGDSIKDVLSKLDTSVTTQIQ
jgi:hypothetical protein